MNLARLASTSATFHLAALGEWQEDHQEERFGSDERHPQDGRSNGHVAVVGNNSHERTIPVAE